jgi:two-component system sensor histidine kinase UhpB
MDELFRRASRRGWRNLRLGKGEQGVATSDAQTVSAPAPRERPRPGWRWGRLSLLWRIFLVNIAVWVVGFALLAWTPLTVHRVATPRELGLLSILLVAMLAIDLVLLRRVLAPLRRLAVVMGAVDPGQPGRRAETPSAGGGEVVALAHALNAMLDRLEDERRESTRRALVAQEGERARVARELHDEVGQTLTAVALRAERAAARPRGQGEALSEIAETVKRSLADVQRIGRELRPEALDDLGLSNALLALCTRVARQAGLPVRREIGHLPPLPDDVELVIYRVAQEAVTNAFRHADAGELRVALHAVDGRVLLRVADDGRGLPERRREGGLAGMRERAMLIGARLEVTSSLGHGTEVLLTVPLEERR